MEWVPSRYLLFKVNNRNTRTMCEICSKLIIKAKEQCQSFRCFYYQLWTYFTPCSSVCIVSFEHVIAGWLSDYWQYFSDPSIKLSYFDIPRFSAERKWRLYNFNFGIKNVHKTQKSPKCQMSTLNSLNFYQMFY